MSLGFLFCVLRAAYRPMIVAGVLGHSISILLFTSANFIPTTMHDQSAEFINPILAQVPIGVTSQS